MGQGKEAIKSIMRRSGSAIAPATRPLTQRLFFLPPLYSPARSLSGVATYRSSLHFQSSPGRCSFARFFHQSRSIQHIDVPKPTEDADDVEISVAPGLNRTDPEAVARAILTDLKEGTWQALPTKQRSAKLKALLRDLKQGEGVGRAMFEVSRELGLRTTGRLLPFLYSSQEKGNANRLAYLMLTLTHAHTEGSAPPPMVRVVANRPDFLVSPPFFLSTLQPSHGERQGQSRGTDYERRHRELWGGGARSNARSLFLLVLVSFQLLLYYFCYFAYLFRIYTLFVISRVRGDLIGSAQDIAKLLQAIPRSPYFSLADGRERRPEEWSPQELGISIPRSTLVQRSSSTRSMSCVRARACVIGCSPGELVGQLKHERAKKRDLEFYMDLLVKCVAPLLLLRARSHSLRPGSCGNDDYYHSFGVGC
jgi:hypothetical protein